MTKKQKKMLLRVLVSLVLLVAAALLPFSGWPRLTAFLVPYILIGWDVLWKAVRNIAHGQVFDENFLMALATVGAFCTGEFPEGVAVMLFYQVGELFQSYAVGKSRQSIASLMDIRPDYANIERGGELVQVDPDEVAVGDTIVIKSGEKVPLDGVVLEGASTLNTAALTGESLPRDVEPGDDVISGCINQSGLLKVRVTKVFGESTVARILDLVENSSSPKGKGRKLYYQVCPLLYAGGRNSRLDFGHRSAFVCRRLVQLDSPCVDLPGHFLPLCAGHFGAAQLFRRHRRRLKMRHFGEGRQLHGSAGTCGARGF